MAVDAWLFSVDILLLLSWLSGVIALRAFSSLVPSIVGFFDSNEEAVQPSTVTIVDCFLHFIYLLVSYECKGSSHVLILSVEDNNILDLAIGFKDFFQPLPGHSSAQIGDEDRVQG